MSVLISVCVPVYNQAPFIGRAIQSALDQEVDLEVIVVDNRSDDGTWETIQSFTDPRVRAYRNDHNLGMFGNFNRCRELCRGESVRFLCGDDELTPRTLLREAKILHDHADVVLVSTAYQYRSIDGSMIAQPTGVLPPGHYRGQQLVILALQALASCGQNVFSFPSGVLLRRSAMDLIGPFDTTLDGLADYDYWLRCLQVGNAYLSEDVGCLITEHPHRASNEWFWQGKYMRGHMEVLRRSLPMLEQSGVDTAALLSQMSGRCLWYMLRSAAAGRLPSLRVHYELLQASGASYSASILALVREGLRRVRRQPWRGTLTSCSMH